MLRIAVLVLVADIALALLSWAPHSQSFVLLPAMPATFAATTTGVRPSTTATLTATYSTASTEGTAALSSAGKSRLSIRNEHEGYDLNGVLTLKHDKSKAVWVLCHGLCSSCEGTVPRFVSEQLDANTFRRALWASWAWFLRHRLLYGVVHGVLWKFCCASFVEYSK